VLLSEVLCRYYGSIFIWWHIPNPSQTDITCRDMKGRCPLWPLIGFHSGGGRERKENSNLFCTSHLTVTDCKQHPQMSHWRLVLSNYLTEDSRITPLNTASQNHAAVGQIARIRVATRVDNSRGRGSITGGHETPNKPAPFCLRPEDQGQVQTTEIPSVLLFFLQALLC